MIVKLTNSRGESVTLSKIIQGYRIKEISGLNPADAEVALTEYALSNGSKVTNKRIPKRNIVIDFYITNPQAEKAKLRLYELLHTGDTIRFDYTTANISAYAEGVLESFETKSWQAMPSFQLSLLCPDPYMYSAEETSVTYAYTAGGFQFPLPDGLAIPEEGLAFSLVNPSTAVSIMNHGTETGLTITAEFNGTASYFGLLDTATDELLTVGYNFLPGDILTIQTGDAQKKITLKRNSVERNIINQLVAGSTWLQASRGQNTYRVRTDGLQNVEVVISFRTKYTGV